jgi:hypothetical protein
MLRHRLQCSSSAPTMRQQQDRRRRASHATLDACTGGHPVAPEHGLLQGGSQLPDEVLRGEAADGKSVAQGRRLRHRSRSDSYPGIQQTES